MKRKAQSTEFRPPKQKTARVSRLNSRKSTTSDETSELQPADRNQIGSQSLLYLQSASLIDSYEEHQPEIDSGLFKILADVEQTSMNKTESAERNDIKNKPQSGLTLEHEPKAAAAFEEMDNETNDTSSHEPQTSHVAQRSPNSPCHTYSLDETGEGILCDVQENRFKVLDPKTSGVHLEGFSGAVGEKSCLDSETKSQATEETESLKPPAKKRLKRRMGMCGLGDRKRRFLLERQHCKQALSGGERLEVAEATGKKNKDNTVMENEGTAIMDDGGTTKQVLLEQVILVGALLTGQDVNKVQDEPSVVASEPDLESIANAEPNLPGTGTVDSQDLEITMNPKGLVEEEILSSNNKLTKGTLEVARETTDSLVVEEANYGCIYVTNGVCEGPKETLECSVEVTKEVSLIGLTNEVCDGFKETETCPVAQQVSYGVTCDVWEGSKETSEYPVGEQVSFDVTRDICEGSKETSEYPVAEQVGYGVSNDICEGSKETSEYPVAEQESYGVTRDVCEGSKETSEYPVAEQVGYGVSNDICEGSKETSEYPVAEQESYGVTCDVCEGSKETSEYPVAEQVNYSVTRDVCEGSKETSEYPVAEQVSYGVTNDICEGSKETSEYPVAEQESYCVIRDICEGSKETSEYPVAEQVNYGLTRDVCDGSKETSECPVAEQVSYGVTNDICEGSKENSEYLVTEQVSSGVPDDVCEVLTEATQGPVTIYEAVIYESTSVTEEVCEDSNETTEFPGATGVIYGSIAVTDEIREVLEGSEETTEGPVTVNEAPRYSSTAVSQKETSEYPVTEQVSHGVTTDICECSKETAQCPVTAKVFSSPICATGDIYKGSKEAPEGPVDKALKVFYGSTGITNGVCESCKETTELPVNVGEEVNYGSSSVSDEVRGGSKAPVMNQSEVSEEVSYGSVAATNKVCDGFIDPTERPTEIPEVISCGFTGVNEVHEISIPVSKEVLKSRTALEKSEMEVEEQCPAVNLKHFLDLDATTELDLDGPQLSMSTATEIDPVFMDHTVTAATVSIELAFSEICDAEDQCDDVEFPQTPTKAVPGSIGPSVEGGSNTEELSVPEAPPTDQEEHMHFHLGQDTCDPLVTPDITQEPVSNPTLTPATEFPQDHDIVPLSLCSVTDSQLNSIALSLEMDNQPIPEACLYQEDASELVCGLVKELSSLNRIVMAAHRETELLRRGNRPPKAPIRRHHGPHNSEI